MFRDFVKQNWHQKTDKQAKIGTKFLALKYSNQTPSSEQFKD